jgi:hypothetical protein
MKEEFPVGQPGDVVDFKNLLNSLDFFVSFSINEKRKRSKNSIPHYRHQTKSLRPRFWPLRKFVEIPASQGADQPGV